MNRTPKSPDPPPPGNATTADEIMTGALRGYLRTLCEEAGETFEPDLTTAEARRRIDRLRDLAGRRRDH
jgi:hypothetical protein